MPPNSADGLTVVPIKNGSAEWAYVIADSSGRVVARGLTGPNGGPLVTKGAARRAGAARLKLIEKNQKRVEKELKRRR